MTRSWALSGVLVALLISGGCATTDSASIRGTTLDRIKATKSVAFGYRESSTPFSFAGPEGKPAGYSVDLCNRVAADLRRDLALPDLSVKWVPVTVESRVRALRDGTIDLECGSTTNTLSRQKEVDFSLTTWITGGSLLVLRELASAELQNLRIAVIPGTTTERILKSALGSATTVQWVPVKDHAEGRTLVENKGADAYASDREILVGLALTAKDPGRFAIGDRLFSYEPYALMLRRGDPDFRLAVDTSLARLYRSGDVIDIYRRWFGVLGPPNALLLGTYAILGLPE